MLSTQQDIVSVQRVEDVPSDVYGRKLMAATQNGSVAVGRKLMAVRITSQVSQQPTYLPSPFLSRDQQDNFQGQGRKKRRYKRGEFLP